MREIGEECPGGGADRALLRQGSGAVHAVPPVGVIPEKALPLAAPSHPVVEDGCRRFRTQCGRASSGARRGITNGSQHKEKKEASSRIMLAAGDTRQQTQRARGQRLRQAEAILRHRCRREQVGLEELRMGSRRRRIAAVRARLAVDFVTRLGLSLAETARQLGVSTSGIAKAVATAEQP